MTNIEYILKQILLYQTFISLFHWPFLKTQKSELNFKIYPGITGYILVYPAVYHNFWLVIIWWKGHVGCLAAHMYVCQLEKGLKCKAVCLINDTLKTPGPVALLSSVLVHFCHRHSLRDALRDRELWHCHTSDTCTHTEVQLQLKRSDGFTAGRHNPPLQSKNTAATALVHTKHIIPAVSVKASRTRSAGHHSILTNPQNYYCKCAYIHIKRSYDHHFRGNNLFCTLQFKYVCWGEL